MAVSSAIEGNPDNVNGVLNAINYLKDMIEQAFGKDYLKELVKLALPRLNMESAKTLKEIAKNISDRDLTEKVNNACDNVKLWIDLKEKSFRTYFTKKTNGGSQTEPVALILLVTTLLPFANHIFNN